MQMAAGDGFCLISERGIGEGRWKPYVTEKADAQTRRRKHVCKIKAFTHQMHYFHANDLQY